LEKWKKWEKKENSLRGQAIKMKIKSARQTRRKLGSNFCIIIQKYNNSSSNKNDIKHNMNCEHNEALLCCGRFKIQKLSVRGYLATQLAVQWAAENKNNNKMYFHIL